MSIKDSVCSECARRMGYEPLNKSSVYGLASVNSVESTVLLQVSKMIG